MENQEKVIEALIKVHALERRIVCDSRLVFGLSLLSKDEFAVLEPFRIKLRPCKVDTPFKKNKKVYLGVKDGEASREMAYDKRFVVRVKSAISSLSPDDEFPCDDEYKEGNLPLNFEYYASPKAPLLIVDHRGRKDGNLMAGFVAPIDLDK
jgi:hypothetical protein